MVGDSVPFEEVASADLVIDRVYEGGTRGHAGDDPLSRMFRVGNSGGFRFSGSISGELRLLILYSDSVQTDWPDFLDPTTGDFTYFGDNRSPGRDLLAPRGNRILDRIFAASHGSADDRDTIPPILFFEKAGPRGRSVRFRGLLAPGSHHLTTEEDLVAVWRTTSEKRFQNYRSHFTALDAGTIRREWLDDRLAGIHGSPSEPRAWATWIKSRIYQPLIAPRTVIVRSTREQYPHGATAERDLSILRTVYRHFADAQAWAGFEHFAADMWLGLDPNVESIDVTRPTRDGGRDGIGTYLMGPRTDPIRLEFALEAKCYEPGRSGLGVRAVARLVSRIKHREFGVFVTTAHIADQAYREIREDGHPIVFMTGADIVNVLRAQGIRSVDDARRHLEVKYPTSVSDGGATSAPSPVHMAIPDYLDDGTTVEVDVALPSRHEARSAARQVI